MLVFDRKDPIQNVLNTCRGKLHIKKKAKGAALLEGEEVSESAKQTHDTLTPHTLLHSTKTRSETRERLAKAGRVGCRSFSTPRGWC